MAMTMRRQHHVASPTSATAARCRAFGYDWLDRLTSASTSAVGQQVNTSRSYSYDAIGNITNMAGSAYSYGATQPHAVTAAHGNSYGYDSNGNQTNRTIAGTAYTQIFDRENRLVEIKEGSTVLATFVYDADGNRVVGTVDSVETFYIAGIYEWVAGSNAPATLTESNETVTTARDLTAVTSIDFGPAYTISSGGDVDATVSTAGTITLKPGFSVTGGGLFHAVATTLSVSRSTTYYSGPGGVVAFRRSGYDVDNGVFYLLRDHLGSSSVIVDSSGAVVSNEYYFPYGGNRGAAAHSELTTKRFTGQYHEAGLPGGEGLSYYNARWYDAQVGRFVSADTIVPKPMDPQAFNRMAYVLNSPLRFIDPTGHIFDDFGGLGSPLHDPGPPGGSEGKIDVFIEKAAGRRKSQGARYGDLPQNIRKRISRSDFRKLGRNFEDRVHWRQNMQDAVPLTKDVLKELWLCPLALGTCPSSQEWSGSLDLGGFWGPAVVARGTISIAFDSDTGVALILAKGVGGSTPTINAGPGITMSNAPSINDWNGDSVAFGGSADVGLGVMGELILFTNNQTGQTYQSLGISGVGSVPDPLIGSVHTTYEHTTTVWSINFIDTMFLPIEWILSED